jgi:hypothetical protein
VDERHVWTGSSRAWLVGVRHALAGRWAAVRGKKNKGYRKKEEKSVTTDMWIPCAHCQFWIAIIAMLSKHILARIAIASLSTLLILKFCFAIIAMLLKML